MRHENLKLRSPAFAHEETMPSKYTCDGENISPPLAISGVPEGTETLVLIMEDPDVPPTIREDGMWDHWLLFNIPSDTAFIGEGEVPECVRGLTTRNVLQYGGPCPPDGEHRYLFRLYALDTTLDVPEGSTKEAVHVAMRGHVLESTTLMGRYARVV
jgi:Raf kinase inhibitor-like YbhB/YbcL family protein